MRILVTGATGFIGSHIIKALIKEGHEVAACVRDIDKAARIFGGLGLGFIKCDFTRDHDPSVWTPRLKGVDIVINAVGIIREDKLNTFDALHAAAPKALFKASESAGVKKIVQISAIGADKGAKSGYHLTKKEADDFLKTLKTDWVVIQPSVVFGRGGKSAEFFTSISALPVIPLIGDGGQKLQPVYIEDLVRLVTKAASDASLTRLTIEAVGPAPITYKEMLLTYRGRLGLNRPIFLNIPIPFMRIVAMVGGLSKNSPLDKETLLMLLRGSVGDPVAFTRITGARPIGIKEALSMTPSTVAERFYAKLFNLMPLLRMSIGVVWIFAGAASLFIYPFEKSYGLLREVGIGETYMPFVLYGASFFDMALGAAFLSGFRLRFTGSVKIAAIVLYSFIIAVSMPEFLFHPFGPIVKNIPLIAATLLVMAAEE